MPPLVDHPENFGLQHSSEIGRDRTRGTLQHFIFGEELLEPALYYVARSRVGVPLGRLRADRAGLHTPPRAEVSFASLLNAFFERHWVEQTSLLPFADLHLSRSAISESP